MAVDRCSHVYRSGPLVAGCTAGASLGQCEAPCLPGFTVCAEHVCKEALLLRLAQVEKRP